VLIARNAQNICLFKDVNFAHIIGENCSSSLNLLHPISFCILLL